MPRPEDTYFMRLALEEGRKGLGHTSPNPPVGAVVVKANRVVGRGYHARAGEPHAEVNALRGAGAEAQGATLYVTLEPCHHHGRTPPCTKAILEAGIRRVVVGALDPNPVAQGGLDFLAQQGLETESGVLEEECLYLARFFLHAVKKRLPWVISKVAASLDGRVATKKGDSQWITGPQARKVGHHLRHICDAILVGKGTVASDNPSLTCRLPHGKDPVRLILDSNLSLNPEAYQIFSLSSPAQTIVVAGEGCPEARLKSFQEKGLTVWLLPRTRNHRIDLKALLKRLLKEGLLSLLVEGGPTVHGSFFDAGLVNEVYFFYGPVVIGGQGALGSVLGEGPERLSQAWWLKRLKVETLSDSVLITGLVTELSELKPGAPR